MDAFTDEELAAELRRARLLRDLAETSGEVDAANVYASTARALELEQSTRAGH